MLHTESGGTEEKRAVEPVWNRPWNRCGTGRGTGVEPAVEREVERGMAFSSTGMRGNVEKRGQEIEERTG